MVTSLIKQSVEIKMNFKASCHLISDYEYAYAIGYAAKKLGIHFNLNEEKILEDCGEEVKKGLENIVCKDYKEENLYRMIQEYKPAGTFAPQISELLNMGQKAQ